MASLDVDSLFTNTPLDETTDICIDNLYNSNENPRTFSSKIFVVRPPLDPTLANIFICSFESRWLRDYPDDFKPVL